MPLFVVYVGNGMALPNAIAGAVSVRPEAAGTASGVTGFVQMGWGAVIAQLIAYPMAGGSAAMAMTLIMLAQAVAWRCAVTSVSSCVRRDARSGRTASLS